ncbi:hypothetical protein [Aromatoleum anaerobium]|uniref:hypothetical protein n=1 Tax=Aromatoleum anaerobium TaxID=182180 RepID=UPI00145D8CC4|nr:hypothetical protein [Aromatoleum anaerobium]MCK0507956.1 hypothetical protein [Aromatoleum anaerobium]
MSLITLVRRSLRKATSKSRAATIRRLEQDIDWARASSDAHINDLEARLRRLRAENDPRSSQDIAREAGQRAKGVA